MTGYPVESGENSMPPAAVPVWAPNPAVPLPARILAYLFGGFTLLTVLLSILVDRPPDTPPTPKSWAAFPCTQHCTISYPTGWDVQSPQIKDGEEHVFSLLPGSPVRIESILMQLPGVAHHVDSRQIERLLKPELERRFDNFTVRKNDGIISEADDGEQSFNFTLKDNTTKMTGVWAVRASGHSLLLFVATTPENGWGTMREIVDHMLSETKFE